MLKKYRILILIVYLIASWNKLHGISNSFVPDAPVINFKLPMFAKEGYRSWSVAGNEGVYINQDQVNVAGMTICLYSGDQRELIEALIDSPQADIFINENRATGKDLIEVRGNGYFLVGKNWTWEGTLKKMRINKEVKVQFDQSLKGILDYEK